MRGGTWGGVLLGVGMLAASAAGRGHPHLECTTQYSGAVESHAISPAADPYTVKPFTNERFAFKVVWLDAPADVASVTLDVAVVTDDGDIPLHHAKHRPPYPVAAADAPYGFTGLVSVYEQDLGREFQYWCRWAP